MSAVPGSIMTEGIVSESASNESARRTRDEFRATVEAYDRWARSYPPVPHNPLMRAEEALMRHFWPRVRGRRALDLACGTGRYAQLLQREGAAHVTALDSSAVMLAQVTTGARLHASMMSLPLAPASMDVVICGLAVGHAPDLPAWHREIARVLSSGGDLLYSDFHPDAAQIGLKRSFEDEDGRTTVVPHHRYTAQAHEESLAAAGFELETLAEARLGIELREAFPGSEALYERWRGLPLVLVVRARRLGDREHSARELT